MIIKYLIDLVLYLGNFILGSFPDYEFPFDLSAYLDPVAAFVGYMNTFVNLGVVALCISAILVYDNWAFVVKLSIKIWEMLPFV